MAPEQPHVRVTLDKIYEELLSLKSDVQELKLTSTKEEVKDLRARIGALETWRWLVVGMATSLSTVIPIAITVWSKS